MTPSEYQREVYEEVGVPNPRFYTHWKLEKEQGPGHPMARLEDGNAFVPINTERGTVIEHRKHVKEMYYKDIVTSGPLSHILEEERIQRALQLKDAALAGKGETTIIIGSASQGISSHLLPFHTPTPSPLPLASPVCIHLSLLLSSSRMSTFRGSSVYAFSVFLSLSTKP